MKHIKEAIIALIIIFCLGLMIIGGLFKIMHWPGANQMLIASMFSLVLLYAISIGLILTKKVHRKFVWIIAALISPVSTLIIYLGIKDDLKTEIEFEDK